MSAPGAPTSARPPKLAIVGVAVTYPGSPPVRALEPIDLEVRAGELVCLLGPSGCGKSTLLQVVGGFLAPTAGLVKIDGERVTGPDRRRIFVFQERGVFPWLTVADNIGFGLDGLPAAARAQKVATLIELVGLAGFAGAYPHELSGGMKQRVEVARALAVDPDMLFLDEPFGALDSITRHGMRGELLRLWALMKQTILMVTHDVDESVLIADRVVVMSSRPGRVQRVVDVDLARPRDLSDPRFLAIRDAILAEIGLAHVV